MWSITHSSINKNSQWSEPVAVDPSKTSEIQWTQKGSSEELSLKNQLVMVLMGIRLEIWVSDKRTKN